MTGFGRATAESDNIKVTIEIRCLNSRQLDITMKAPTYFRETEQEIRTVAGEKLIRGKSDIWINIEYKQLSGGSNVNKAMIYGYFRDLEPVAKDLGVSNATILESILRIPDIYKSDDSTATDQDKHALFLALGEALEKVNLFREKEGQTLFTDILQRAENIRKGLAHIESFEVGRRERFMNRLRENVQMAIGKESYDTNRFEEELIYYLEKMDITEEKVRLGSHLNYFEEVAKDGTDAGRKLGFLGQEIGREINTIGSKANDAGMQKEVVGMKDELEKIKEQLLNIL